MKRLTVILFLLLCSLSVGLAAEVDLEWAPSPEPETVGYHVHWGTTSRGANISLDVFSYDNVETATSAAYTVNGVTENGTTYFSVTAFGEIFEPDFVVFESPFSNEAKVTYKHLGAPAGLQVTKVQGTQKHFYFP